MVELQRQTTAALEDAVRRRIEVGGCRWCGGAVEHRVEMGYPETVCLICGRRPRPVLGLPLARVHTRREGVQV